MAKVNKVLCLTKNETFILLFSESLWGRFLITSRKIQRLRLFMVFGRDAILNKTCQRVDTLLHNQLLCMVEVESRLLQSDSTQCEAHD